jgi:hypothetical protein
MALVWSDSWVQWPSPTTIFAHGFAPGRPSICGSACYIQAFGYDANDVEQATRDAELPAVWYLVRQDLYLNDQATAFLIVHWKHTLNFISLLDVIPGDGTELIGE